MAEFPLSPEAKERIRDLVERLTECAHRSGLDDCEIAIAAMSLVGKVITTLSDVMFDAGDLNRLTKSDEVAGFIEQINAMFTQIDIEERKNG